MHTLYKHQENVIEIAKKNNGCIGIFHDPGLGKTLSTLEIFSYFRSLDPTLRMLVTAPLSLIRAAWGEDIKRFTKFKYLPYSDIKRVPKGHPNCGADADIIGINFESLITASRLKEVILSMSHGNWMIAVDESSRMRNHKSVTTKTLLRLAPMAKYRIIASGTPAMNGEWEYFSQCKFVNPNCFPDSFFAFRNTYFHLARGNQVMQTQGRIMTRGLMQQIFSQGWQYKITPEKREILLSKIKPFCDFVKKEDALDLPEKVFETREVKLNPNERRAYEDMRKHLICEIKESYSKNAKVEQITAEVCLTKLQKLHQLTSGFCYTEEHDAVRPGRSSKMRELANVMEEVVGKKQAIIWISYREEVKAISKMLEEDGISFVTLYAETKDKDASITDFKSGKAQVLLCNSQAAGHGLTFVNCSISIYFSISYSAEQFIQSQDRTHRIGMKDKCLYILLIATKTIDEMILAVLNRKMDLRELIYKLVQEEKD